MFARADQLRIEDMENSFRLHAIYYSWEDFDPQLVIFDLDDGQLKVLGLDDVDFSISKKRVCVGSFIEDEYVPCPRDAPVTKFSQCPECGEKFIPVQECIFEPKCEGDLCDSPLCRKEHAVYIAFFGDKPKVGMTTRGRIRSRLIEQGADAYFVASTYPTRKAARTNEKMIGEKLRITERPANKTILESLRMPRRRTQIEEGWRWIASNLEEKFSLHPDDLEFLDSYPLEEPLTCVPKQTDIWGNHTGKLIGVKGKFMIYESDRLLALKLSDIPSRYVSRGLL
ncbi:MAG: DUF2797 domain-containing protein [Thermoplasmata archaeon]|nr:DUF2797 domain-containing protein [Thermoplasmata archaeon]